MSKQYTVSLSPEDRQTLEAMLRHGGLSFRQQRRIRTLLLVDEGETDEAIAEELETHRSSIERTRKRFHEAGLKAALGERARSGRPVKLDGKAEALVVALACSQAPDGQTRWTLRQLAERLVALEVVEEISHETMRRLLKKRAQAVAKAVVVPARWSEWRLRLPHGGDPGPVRATGRPAAAGGLLR
jgi:transposase